MSIGPGQLTVGGPFVTEFDGLLREYVRAVARGWHIGPESCVLDMEQPAWAYIALEWTLARYPGRDLALLWDERTGWAVAIETHSSEDLIVVACPVDAVVVPPPARVWAFVDQLTAHEGWAGSRYPTVRRSPGRHDELVRRLARALEPGLS
jgi:uncharacterized protein DUF6292